MAETAVGWSCSMQRRLLLPAIHRCRMLSNLSLDSEQHRQRLQRDADEAAARRNELDLSTAARMLLSQPTRRKKFGFDFHLWQFFLACLPPFAVYLTAQYARSDMRRMEKELGIPPKTKEDWSRRKHIPSVPPEEFQKEVMSLKKRLDSMEDRFKQLEADKVLLKVVEDHIREIKDAEAKKHKKAVPQQVEGKQVTSQEGAKATE